MSRVTSTGDAPSGDSNRAASLAASVLIAIRSSFIAFVGALGTVFLSLSLLLSELVVPELYYGVVAGMCFVWGASAYLYAVGGYVGLRLVGYS